jgi:GTP-binding protein EngB required for normal cell division
VEVKTTPYIQDERAGDEMRPTGYEAAGRATDELAGSVDLVAMLIGDRSEQPISVNGVSILPGLGIVEEAKLLTARAREHRQGLFSIIVVGEFKNGKSTLLNAMLGGRILPAKAAPATAVITVLVAGSRPEVALYEGGAEPRLLSHDEFMREFQLTPADQESIQEQGSVDRFARVEYAEIETRNRLCALGVKLIDSPGLGEHVTRTRVATSFLKRSQAVILVLNGTRILTEDETQFIESVLGAGPLPHVFFVVNRMDQVDKSSAVEIKHWVRTRLDAHFRTPDGQFDSAMFDRRVFFVRARTALEARAEDIDGELLAESGVPALELELERFLTSHEKVAAALRSMAATVDPVVGTARDRIRQLLIALDEPLRLLEERRRAAEIRLQKLEERRTQIERTIATFSDTIKRKIYADLMRFVDGLQGSWPEDSRRLMDLGQAVSLKGVVQSYTSSAAREAMASAINVEIQRYLQAKFGQWSERIPAVIRQDVDVLMAEVESQIGDIQLELNRIAASFAGTASSYGRSTGTADSPTDGAGILRVALPLSEISDLTDDALGVNDVGNLFGSMIQRSVVVYMVRTFMTGSFAVASLVVEVAKMGLGESDVKNKIRSALGDRLIPALREQVKEREGFIHHTIDERFQRFAGTALSVTGRQIEEVRAEQDHLLRQRRDQGFSVQAEKNRLNTIDSLVSATRQEIHRLAGRFV